MPFLTPRRRFGTELLDAPGANEALTIRTVDDIARSNVLFGGTRAALAELRLLFPALAPAATLLDVGTGGGDVPRCAQRAAVRAGVSLATIGLDRDVALARRARSRLSHAVCGDGAALPFRDRSVDIVLCSQTLHHFRGDAATALVRELTRVARIGVVVSDLRRSWLAVGGFWTASFPLRFHPVTRHDGVISVLRGYTPDELADTVADAIGERPAVHRRPLFRLTTSWRVRA